MKSLRVKMTILIALVVLVSSGVLLLFSYQRAMNSMSSQLEISYSIAADKYAQELTALINTNATMIDTMASELTVTKLFDKSYEEFHSFLKVSFDLLNKKGYMYDIYFTYPDNHMACASDFVVDGSMDYVHDREWYTVAAETGEIFYSTPYLDSDSGLPIVTISKAVYTDGTLRGVLAADIFVKNLEEILSKAEVEPDSYAFLIDQNMGMIVHPNEAYSFDDKPLGVLDISDAQYEEVISNIQSGSKDTVYLKDYDGVVRGFVISKMTNTGWYVGIATSKDELMRGAGALIRGFTIAAIAAVVVGGLIAVFLAFLIDKLTRQQQEYEAKMLRLEKMAADEANRAKSAFLADMSHEIRTPINAILGMNEMIMRETGEKEILDYSKNIKSSGNNLLQLVNSILDFSKIEGGKMEIIPVKYKLGTMINYVVNSVKERAASKNLEFIVSVDSNLPSELFGDDTRLEQVTLNILSNAVKYTAKGYVKLVVKENERKDGSVLLYVGVSDTGIGIREDDMGRLFESFERLDVVQNRNIEGTGLGMAITTRLLELMDSELKVKSTYGTGSVFSFEVWQKIEDDTPIGDYEKTVPGVEKLKSYRESFRAPKADILIVDDTRMNISVILNLLKTTEVKMESAENGSDAIKMTEKKRYDVILLDQRMPGMDGVETLKAIQADEKNLNSKTPIICLTADAIRGARERYLKEGFSDYLSKPVEGAELEDMLLKYIPKEKIIKTSDNRNEEIASEEPADEGKEKDILLALKELGLDTESAMDYCQNDLEFYISVLNDYIADHETKKDKLSKFYKQKKWNDYSIIAHSLKSTSKTIGALELSEKAAFLEKASKEKKASDVTKEHENALKMYESLVKTISAKIPKKGNSEKDDVIEFIPENKE
ncbi:MAG: response regulator [Lachnospiraceae bacterium]|nr:response regulator [Lachnospiraceae bacterium]